MFIKFVHYPNTSKGTMVERVIECREFHQGYSEKGREATFMIDSPTRNYEVVVQCVETSVYIMSNEGKTIDSYKWRGVDGIITRM